MPSTATLAVPFKSFSVIKILDPFTKTRKEESSDTPDSTKVDTTFLISLKTANIFLANTGFFAKWRLKKVIFSKN